MKRVLVFDLDGVLFDTVEMLHQYTQELYPGFSRTEVADLHRGNIHEEVKKITRPKKPETEEEAIERNRIYTEKKANSPLYPGIKELLKKLAKDNYLTINTSARADNCLPLLEQVGVAKYFSLIATKELAESKVEKFKLIAEKFVQKPTDLLFITDTLGDLREAAVLSVPTIAVTWGMHGQEHFTEEKYDNLLAVVDSVGELSQML